MEVLSTVTSRFASTASSMVALLGSAGRQVDATLSARSVENARSALDERRRAVRLLRAVDRTSRGVAFDRSA